MAAKVAGHHPNLNNVNFSTMKQQQRRPKKHMSSRKETVKSKNKGTEEEETQRSSSSQGFNFGDFTQKRKDDWYSSFEQYRKRSRKSNTTEGLPNPDNDGTSGDERRNEPGTESESQPSLVVIKTEKTDNGNIITTPEDEEMSPEVTETAEGIKKMTIEEIQQMKLRQQLCEGDSDSLSKGITEGDTWSQAKSIPPEPSLVLPQYQQSTPAVSGRTQTSVSQRFTAGKNQTRTKGDTSSLAKPITDNRSFSVSSQRQQSVPVVTSRMPVSTISKTTAQGDSQMMTDGDNSSFAVHSIIPVDPQCQHYMHRPTMVSTETQTESPRLVSTVTQTEEVSIGENGDNNPMMQQGQLVPMTSQQMHVQPVHEQNVALVQRSNSMEVERYEDSDASSPVDLNTAGNSALFVSRTWANDFGRSTLFNRFLASLVAMLGMTVCTPVLQRSKKPMVKDSESGVIQIHPDEGKLSKLTQRQPRVDWFFQHRSIFPHLSQLPNVKSVIGYLSIGEDKGLIDAAKDFKQSLYPRAKLIFFNLAIPEDFGDTEGEANALDRATEADVVFSVGHHTYYHFENKYKALFEAEPKHYLYLPPLTDMFINTKVVPTEGKQQVLSVCNVSSEADFDKYSLGAIAMGKLVNAYYHAYERLPVWSIIGVEKNMLSKFEKFLQDKADSRQLRINVYSSNSLKDFRRSLLQSVLFIAPEKVDSFNFTAYLAMQAGIPVLVPNCSGLVTFLDSLFRYKDYSGFCGVETGLHDFSLDKDGDRWKDAMISRLNANRRNISFKKAIELKNDLMNCEELKTSHERFLRELV
ncbi:serine-rich adhesin for platelets-like [Ptychodera flava]|uniref:serine-rich adhesin for platelets-like n=1 Tax=Ptychodera flava TaxID=63121 RepID=UPI00396A8303